MHLIWHERVDEETCAWTLGSLQHTVGCSNQGTPHCRVRFCLNLCSNSACHSRLVPLIFIEDIRVVNHIPMHNPIMSRAKLGWICAYPTSFAAPRLEQAFAAIDAGLCCILYKRLAAVICPLAHVVPPVNRVAVEAYDKYDHSENGICICFGCRTDGDSPIEGPIPRFVWEACIAWHLPAMTDATRERPPLLISTLVGQLAAPRICVGAHSLPPEKEAQGILQQLLTIVSFLTSPQRR